MVIVESVTAALEHLDLVVDPLGYAVGDAVIEVGQDAMEPAADPLGELDKCIEAAVLTSR